MDSLDNKIAIVTGSAQGIGEAIALSLAKRGCVVCLLDIKEELNNKVAKKASLLSGKECPSYRCDISKENDIEKIFDKIYSKFGKIDILINNAAVFSMFSLVKDSYKDAIEDYRYNMDTNMFGTFACIKKVAPIMARQRSGEIINVNTNHIKRYLYRVSKSEHSYDASKYAQLSITESAARELYEYGIKVKGVCPASTRTPMLENYFKPKDLPLTIEKIAKVTHPASLLEKEEVADTICNMLLWDDKQPVGNAYLLMFSRDCEELSKGHVERLAKQYARKED